MKLARLYDTFIQYGIDKDPRRQKSCVRGYSDTAILFGNPETEIRSILAGIDMEVSEILLADRLRQGQAIDLLLAHHPQGKAFAALYEVMQLQVDILVKMGISDKVAAELLEERKREVERKIMPANHTRAVDAARLLNFPFMCVHTPADNHAYAYIHSLLKKQKPKKVKDILDILIEIPEYNQARQNSAGPRIILGNPNRPVGKIFVEMTGGTEGPIDVYDKLYKSGIRTLVSMHLSEQHLSKVKDAQLNVVIAGHISSDTLGLNLLLDRIDKEEKISILSCSGFTRISRNDQI